jgi:hypothetical protein
MNWLRFDQIVPTVPDSFPEIPIARNPVSPALGIHFDSTLVNPFHEQKIVRQAVGIRRALGAESKISAHCRMSNLLICFRAEGPRSLGWLHHY